MYMLGGINGDAILKKKNKDLQLQIWPPNLILKSF